MQNLVERIHEQLDEVYRNEDQEEIERLLEIIRRIDEDDI